MIKSVYCCDFCGKEISEDEYIMKQKYCVEQVAGTKDFLSYVACGECTNKFEKAILQFCKEDFEIDFKDKVIEPKELIERYTDEELINELKRRGIENVNNDTE